MAGLIARSRIAVLTVLAALVGTTLVALNPAPATSAAPTLTTFSLNVRYTLNRQQAMADVSRVLAYGAVGGLQEMSGPGDRGALTRLLRSRGWGWYMPQDAGVATPIVWDARRFSFLSGTSLRVHAAEAGVTPARYINSVVLRDRGTGKRVGFINTHTISQASRNAQATDPRRVPRLRLHIALLENEIRRLFMTTENVVAVGDLNVNYLADRRSKVAGFPTAAMSDLVSFNMPIQGSRGSRSLLDYSMTVAEGSGLAPIRSRIVGGFYSDHDAVVVQHRMDDLFAARALRNVPRGTTGDRTRALFRMQRAVLSAERGGIVRVASGAITSPGMLSAIRQARARGVTVKTKAVRGMRTSIVVVYGIGGAPHRVLTSNQQLVARSVFRPTTVRVKTGVRHYRIAATRFDRLRGVEVR